MTLSVHILTVMLSPPKPSGPNPTKFVEWLAYTSEACKHTFIFDLSTRPRGPVEGSKAISLGICDGVASTVRFWYIFQAEDPSLLSSIQQQGGIPTTQVVPVPGQLTFTILT